MSKVWKVILPVLLCALFLWGLFLLRSTDADGEFVVVLDPGHGGEDPGATVGECFEKDINLAIALLVREQLEQQEGLIVKMTRADDVFVSLTDRADFANEINADLFFCIHANALENNESYSGIFTFYHPDKRSNKKTAEIVQNSVSKVSGGIDRGVRSEDFAVLRETSMPAVLLETGFMTCPDELAKLVDEDYQALIAQGIAEAIQKIRG